MMQKNTQFQRWKPTCSFIGKSGNMNLYQLDFITQTGEYVSLTEPGYNYKMPFYWLYVRACKKLSIPFNPNKPIEHRTIDKIVEDEPKHLPLRFYETNDEVKEVPSEDYSNNGKVPQIIPPMISVPTFFNTKENKIQSSSYTTKMFSIQIIGPGKLVQSQEVNPVVVRKPKIPHSVQLQFKNYSRF